MLSTVNTVNNESIQDPAMAKVSLGEKLGYGAADIASNLIWVAMSMFLTYFYTDVAGLAAGAIGTMFLVARVMDAFVDLGVGVLVDKTKTKYGKARPWLLWMSIPFGVAGVLLFWAPSLGAQGALIYAYVTYLFINIVYSAINLPYSVLGSMITQNPNQRSLLNIFRMTMAMIGVVTVATGTLPMVNQFGGGKTGWLITFTIFGVIAILLFLTTFSTTRERVRPAVVTKSIPFKRGMAALFRNKYWILILLLSTVSSVVSALTSAIGVYYAQYILGNTGLVSLLTVVQLVPTVIVLVSLAPLIKKFGKRNVAIVGTVISVIGFLIPAFAPTSTEMVIISMIIKAIGNAPLTGMIFAMTADTVDYGEWKTGMRTEGLSFSASSFGGKAGSGLGGAIVGWILAWSGYIGGQAAVSASSSQAIQFLFIYLPAALCVLIFLILWFYKLDKEYPKVLQELQQVKEM